MLKAVLALHEKHAAAEPRLRAAQPQHRLRQLALLRQPRAPALAGRRATTCAAPGSAPSALAAPTSTLVLEEYVPGTVAGRRRPARGRRRDRRGRRPGADRSPDAAARRAAARGRQRGGAAGASAGGPRRRRARPRPGAGAARGRRPGRAVPAGHRLRGRRRAGDQGRSGAARPRLGPRQAAGTRWPPSGIFRGTRRAGQGGLPLHRPGLPVRQHAARPARPASRSSPRPSPRPTPSWSRCSAAP